MSNSIILATIFWGEKSLGVSLPFFLSLLINMDLKNFISEEALSMMMTINGWKLLSPIVIEDFAVFKADFYDDEQIIAVSPKGSQIRSLGKTVLKYKDEIFNSISELFLKFGKDSIQSFNEWQFIEEKEWVVFKNGEWTHSFTTLNKLPKTTKLRC